MGDVEEDYKDDVGADGADSDVIDDDDVLDEEALSDGGLSDGGLSDGGLSDGEEGEPDDETDAQMAVVEKVLTQKEQNARALVVRRAIEAQLDQKKLDEDLDYLDLNMED